jgi:Fe-S-cluster containining protein
MKPGDIVKYFVSTGATGALEASTLLGVVTQVGAKTFTVLWESGLRNRVRHGQRGIKLTTDPELIAEAHPSIIAESKRLKDLATTPDCQKCGACCVAFQNQDVFANVHEKDMERLGSKLVRLLVLQPNAFDIFALALSGTPAQAAIKTKVVLNRKGPFSGSKMCRCKALEGDVLHQVKCSIYEKRPQVCREAVKPGDRV